VSLRARLLLVTVLLVSAGVLVADVVTYRAVSSYLVNRVDEQLAAARRPAAFALQLPHRGERVPESEVLPNGTYADVRDADGDVTAQKVFTYGDVGASAPTLPENLPGSGDEPAGETATYTVGSDGDVEYRALATSLGPEQGTFTVAIPLTELRDTQARMLGVMLVVTLVVVGGVVALALWSIRVAMRPLEAMGETAGAIAAGDLSRRVAPADDRTEVGRLGASLNAMLAQIEAAFEERRASEERLRRFVADASHELRTPLTSIRGYAELFRRGASERPEDLERSMARIETEAARMGVLVDDLLLLARLDQGRPLEREPVDLAAVAADAVDAARAADPSRVLDLTASAPAPVLGDAGRLRQVLDNLLENARAHTPEGTPAHVRVASDTAEIVLTVADEGPGIDPALAPALFERFARGDEARSRETGGAGLGLAIVAAIVEAHGGTVRALPSDGGATFEVRLPAAQGAPVPPPPS
jgi:two-component system OmpR family sensor kinase